MRLLSLYTGGKDSTRSLRLAQQDGHEVVALLTITPARDDSYMFHAPATELTTLHAEALGLPLVHELSSGVEGKELDDLERALRGAKERFRLDGVVSGALRSRYQKDRIDALCKRLGLQSIAPLWGMDPETHLRAIIGEGWKVIFSAVAAEGLTEEWLGSPLDQRALDRLLGLQRRFAINIEGEGGEYETLVLWAPGFRGELAVEWRREWSGSRGHLAVVGARLVPHGDSGSTGGGAPR